MSDHLMANYNQLPVAFEKGEGVWLFDQHGNHYLDTLSGIAVCGLGHSHPELTSAISDQAGRLLHTSNLYHIPLQESLASRLCALANMDKVFFCNSGAEANEAAIKIARLHGHKKNIASPVVIVAHGSFHGRTMATLSATGNTKVQSGFEPLLPGFVHVPYNDIDSIIKTVNNSEDVAAVMLEPVQGEGGINIPDSGYLTAVRELCDENGLLMMLDEIQTGMCRTGKWFAHQHENCVPDVMTLAKSLGNGVPIGACLADGEAANLLQPGSHGSTFGGNPLAARAGLTVIDILQRENLAQRAVTLGQLLLARFSESLSVYKAVVNIRGKGLMIGIELADDCPDLVGLALKQNLLINVTAGKIIRLLPPLIISDEQAEEIVERLCIVLKDYLKEAA